MDLETARTLVRVLAEGTPPKPSREDAATPAGYTLERRLGEGAGGVVWLSRRAGSDRPVALKILKRRLGEGKNARRAWRELELLEQVRAPGTPRLADYGTVDDRLYIATEYVAGMPIDAHCDRNGLETRQRVELLVRLCEAVAGLHDSGVIHRDIKPSNVLVTGAGVPVIIDLGIASLLASDVMETLTAEGAPVGTPAFMAPEQARGERAAIGVRSDVWAIGAIGYVLLTGRTPHDLDVVTLYEAVRRVGGEPARDPSVIRPLLPKPLCAVLSKACSAAPADRYGSAGMLADDLQRWLLGEPVDAQAPGPWVRAMRWTLRHPVLTTAGLCAAMVAGAAGLSWAILQQMAFEPYDVQIGPNGSTAWFESRTHREVASLFGDPDPTRRIKAVKIDRPASMGGGWIAVVQVQQLGGWGRIELHDPRTPGEPIWTAPDPGPFPPLAIPAYDDEESKAQHAYRAAKLTIADVFPDREGIEFAFVHVGGPFFPSCLRVFGVDGEELYRVWIPGHTDMLWLEDAASFVLSGVHNRLSRAAEPQLGAERGGEPKYLPRCVMRVRPVEGDIHDRWVTYGIAGSDTNVERCWALVQPATRGTGDLSTVNLSLQPPHMRFDRVEAFAVNLRLDATDAQAAGTQLTCVFDAELRELAPIVPGNLVTANPALSALLDAWKARTLRFEDAPAFDPNPSR